MADLDELLAALDQRLLEVLSAKVPGDAVLKLTEARAWLTNPDQPHGSSMTGG